RLFDQLQHLRALFVVRDAIQRQQIRDVALLEADATALHPAELRFRAADAVRRLRTGDLSPLAQPAQLRAQDEPADGRAGRRLGPSIVERAHQNPPSNCPRTLTMLLRLLTLS